MSRLGPTNVAGLCDAFRQSSAFTQLGDPNPGATTPVGGLPGSAKALFVSLMHRVHEKRCVVCCADEVEAEEWCEDLALFSGASGSDVAGILPELELDEDLKPLGASLRTRTQILGATHRTLMVPMSSLMAPVATLDESSRGTRVQLERGHRTDPRELTERAAAAGYARVPQVLRAGEVSLRGDVLDIFCEGTTQPIRIEFFDDEIESLRYFDPSDQTSTDELESATLFFRDEATAARMDTASEHPFPLDLLDPEQVLVFVIEPARFDEQLSRFTLREGSLSPPVAAFQSGVRRFAAYSLSTLPVTNGHNCGLKAPGLGADAGWDLKGRILAASQLKERPLVVLRSDPEVKRVLRLAKETNRGDPGIDATTGHLTRGFRAPDLGRALLNHGEFFGTGVAQRRVVSRKKRAPLQSRALESFFELSVGDLVVHAIHGIAKFVGMERARRGVSGGEEDHLRLCFQDDVEVLVPASKIDLVNKYVGSGQASPKLDKIGGKSFSRRKASVAQALRDMASDLLDVQVQRQRAPGFACPEEDELYTEFERSFPYEDTPDQAKSTKEIGRDLCSTRPMDRLLCGDVGFGKTELAMRSAFRVASAGRQVAMLVPTTLLADQHGRSFRDRFAPFPIRIEVLSRLNTAKQKREILAAAKTGRVDILIGTHRLLGKEVELPNLGLLLIDEEQRFGVAHKEKIRQLRANVDVLTLTATPIPRTLHMSLLGIKDISSLSTPPPGRLEIETHVAHRSAQVIRGAILRELARGGQVFFLHNRVFDIEATQRELSDLVPEARFVIGHGQMKEGELMRNMQKFLAGEADVLLATTIVESGIDIPRANTILVDNADTFGLADLHQLRGRVGRDVHKAHCFLLVDPTRPLSNEARQRLQAMERFSELGAGFQIAMRDLEIRGAGNLLGPEQSGHIAAIGYDMYCKLLQSAVERTVRPKGRPDELAEIVVSEQVDVDLGVEAYLPESMAQDSRMRLALLRELDQVVDEASFEATRQSLRDRFGRLPPPVENLVAVFLVKHQLGARGMTAARWMPPEQIMLLHKPGRGPHGRWIESFADVRGVRPDQTALVMPPKRRGSWQPEEVLALLRDALLERKPKPRPAKRRRGRK